MGTLKEEFPEFFQEKLLKSDLINSDSLIIVDTNYLLDILRLPTKMAESYINALKQARNKLYIPYLVALEFNFSKSRIKKERHLEIQKYKSNLEKNLNELEDKIDFKELIFDEESKSSYNSEILSLIKDFKINFNTLIENQIEEHILKDYETNYDKLIEIIDDKIGNKYEQEWITSIEEEGEKRYEQSLPPGFNDQKKEDDDKKYNYRHYSNLKYNLKFGDLIIWKDILKHCHEDKENKIKKVIFVTNDNKSSKKSDIMYKIDGLTDEEVKSFESIDDIKINNFNNISNQKLKYYNLLETSRQNTNTNKRSDEKKYLWKLKPEILESMDETEIEELLERLNKNSDKLIGLSPEGYLYESLFDENIDLDSWRY